MIKILIADDHAIVRQGLRQIVSTTSDIEVAGEAETGAELIRLVRDHLPDVVLLDLSLPDRNGIDILKQIHRHHPHVGVVILTMHSEDEFGVRALKAGAAGYLTKRSAPSLLVQVIRQVAGGRRYISPELAEELASRLDGNGKDAPHDALSDREFQTLRMIASGKSLSEMASTLALSPKTVSVYRARLLEKLRLKNNTELTHYAIRNRLVDCAGDESRC